MQLNGFHNLKNSSQNEENHKPVRISLGPHFRSASETRKINLNLFLKISIPTIIFICVTSTYFIIKVYDKGTLMIPKVINSTDKKFDIIYDDLIEPTEIIKREKRQLEKCTDCENFIDSTESVLPAVTRCRKNIEKNKDCCELWKKMKELNKAMEDVKKQFNLHDIPCKHGKKYDIENNKHKAENKSSESSSSSEEEEKNLGPTNKNKKFDNYDEFFDEKAMADESNVPSNYFSNLDREKNSTLNVDEYLDNNEEKIDNYVIETPDTYNSNDFQRQQETDKNNIAYPEDSRTLITINNVYLENEHKIDNYYDKLEYLNSSYEENNGVNNDYKFIVSGERDKSENVQDNISLREDLDNPNEEKYNSKNSYQINDPEDEEYSENYKDNILTTEIDSSIPYKNVDKENEKFYNSRNIYKINGSEGKENTENDQQNILTTEKHNSDSYKNVDKADEKNFNSKNTYQIDILEDKEESENSQQNISNNEKDDSITNEDVDNAYEKNYISNNTHKIIVSEDKEESKNDQQNKFKNEKDSSIPNEDVNNANEENSNSRNIYKINISEDQGELENGLYNTLTTEKHNSMPYEDVDIVIKDNYKSKNTYEINIPKNKKEPENDEQINFKNENDPTILNENVDYPNQENYSKNIYKINVSEDNDELENSQQIILTTEIDSSILYKELDNGNEENYNSKNIYKISITEENVLTKERDNAFLNEASDNKNSNEISQENENDYQFTSNITTFIIHPSLEENSKSFDKESNSASKEEIQVNGNETSNEVYKKTTSIQENVYRKFDSNRNSHELEVTTEFYDEKENYDAYLYGNEENQTPNVIEDETDQTTLFLSRDTQQSNEKFLKENYETTTEYTVEIKKNNQQPLENYQLATDSSLKNFKNEFEIEYINSQEKNQLNSDEKTSTIKYISLNEYKVSSEENYSKSKHIPVVNNMDAEYESNIKIKIEENPIMVTESSKTAELYDISENIFTEKYHEDNNENLYSATDEESNIKSKNDNSKSNEYIYTNDNLNIFEEQTTTNENLIIEFSTEPIPEQIPYTFFNDTNEQIVISEEDKSFNGSKEYDVLIKVIEDYNESNSIIPANLSNQSNKTFDDEKYLENSTQKDQNITTVSLHSNVGYKSDTVANTGITTPIYKYIQNTLSNLTTKQVITSTEAIRMSSNKYYTKSVNINQYADKTTKLPKHAIKNYSFFKKPDFDGVFDSDDTMNLNWDLNKNSDEVMKPIEASYTEPYYENQSKEKNLYKKFKEPDPVSEKYYRKEYDEQKQRENYFMQENVKYEPNYQRNINETVFPEKMNVQISSQETNTSALENLYFYSANSTEENESEFTHTENQRILYKDEETSNEKSSYNVYITSNEEKQITLATEENSNKEISSYYEQEERNNDYTRNESMISSENDAESNVTEITATSGEEILKQKYHEESTKIYCDNLVYEEKNVYNSDHNKDEPTIYANSNEENSSENASKIKFLVNTNSHREENGYEIENEDKETTTSSLNYDDKELFNFKRIYPKKCQSIDNNEEKNYDETISTTESFQIEKENIYFSEETVELYNNFSGQKYKETTTLKLNINNEYMANSEQDYSKSKFEKSEKQNYYTYLYTLKYDLDNSKESNKQEEKKLTTSKEQEVFEENFENLYSVSERTNFYKSNSEEQNTANNATQFNIEMSTSEVETESSKTTESHTFSGEYFTNEILNSSTTEISEPVLQYYPESRIQDNENVIRIVNQNPIAQRFQNSGPSSMTQNNFDQLFQLPPIESSKASQQLTVKTNMLPMCFYGTPNQNAPMFRQLGYEGQMNPFSPSHTAFSAFGYPQIYPNYIGQQGMYSSIMGQQKFGSQNYYNNMQNPYFCTYVPSSSVQFPPISGFSEFRNIKEKEFIFPEDPDDKTIPVDLFIPNLNKSRSSLNCPFDTRSCLDGLKCIKSAFWCDGIVHCKDQSDELGCSCKTRVDKGRLCDGYFDCPKGEDELGCFGCNENEFSCDDWSERHKKASCLPLEERCDGVPQCKTGKDEMDCSLLTNAINEHQTYAVSKANGYLHRNYKGHWYPVCSQTDSWVYDACFAEVGPQASFPAIRSLPIPLNYNGKFLTALTNNRAEFMSTCMGGEAVYVICPPIPCGTRLLPPPNHYRKQEVDTSGEEDFLPLVSRLRRFTDEIKYPHKNVLDNNESEDKNRSFMKKNKNMIISNNILENYLKEENKDVKWDREKRGDNRVVGGKPSQPTSWPWVVAIYRDGIFHCGGVLMSELWVITAAHCVDTYWQHYYEIQAGMLRRFSFSPMEQNRVASYIIGHQLYDRVNMKNDLALLKMDKPFQFNRWVRPICLPSESSAGPNWLMGPVSGTICTAVGWGATVEHGPDPDHMREVEVPILPRCKHREDQEGQEICAGYVEGGRDACQGDSGGPLLCRNPLAPSQWYVAGIVSHGEGCARPNEPGAYTRVSLYLNWIARSILEENLPEKRPLQKCPGTLCLGTHRCISKKQRCDKAIDCLMGDDEMNCPKTNFQSLIKHALDSILLLATQNFTSTKQPEIKSKETNAKNLTRTTETSENNKQSQMEIKEIMSRKNLQIIAEKQHTIETDTIDAFTEVGGQETMNRNGNISSMFTTPAGKISDVISPIFNTEATEKPTPSEFITTSTTDDNISDTTTTSTSKQENIISDIFTTEITSALFSSDEDEITFNESTNKSKKKVLTDKFLCKELLQIIPISRRCNRILDCEDGSDEANCSCKDYLSASYPGAICDGNIDCDDGSDERNCSNCPESYFRCQLSGQCIPKFFQCDHKVDCLFGEDEWDCFALTNGSFIRYDKDERPELRRKGIVSISHSGIWYPLCKSKWYEIASDVAGDMCIYLGFSGYQKFFETRVIQDKIKILPINTKSFSITQESNKTCRALYVKCTNILSDSADMKKIHTAHHTGANTFKEVFNSPWNAELFIDGVYKCSGTLIDKEWVITSRVCLENVYPHKNYSAVMLGSGRGHQNIIGPHEQIRRITEIIPITNSDIVLLKLYKHVTFTRYVRPLYLKNMNEAVSEKETCLAIGRSLNETIEIIFLKPMINKCLRAERCFKRVTSTDNCDHSSEIINPWGGTIVCLSAQGWYPAAVFHERKGNCGFKTSSGYTSVRYFSPNILAAMSNNPFSVEAPVCIGFRCPLGECLDAKKLCDGTADCRDGSDETKDKCKKKKRECEKTNTCDCAPNELKCANGKCIAKSAFCDRKDDCGDLSDEPRVCNCSSYLALVAPHQLCDGISNCYDKTDESSELCGCRENRFKCGVSDVCVPNEYVCDGQVDCPNSEDETLCLALKSKEIERDGVGEVMLRTYGLWHSYCMPNTSFTSSQLENICTEIGYSTGHASLLNVNTTLSSIPAPIVVADDFSFVKLNPYVMVFLRGHYPLAKLEKSKDCRRFYLECT